MSWEEYAEVAEVFEEIVEVEAAECQGGEEEVELSRHCEGRVGELQHQTTEKSEDREEEVVEEDGDEESAGCEESFENWQRAADGDAMTKDDETAQSASNTTRRLHCPTPLAVTAFLWPTATTVVQLMYSGVVCGKIVYFLQKRTPGIRIASGRAYGGRSTWNADTGCRERRHMQQAG
ncbi:hypothetical protein MTO96_039349 [Rhipicephalus appendiculatus]